jgi:DNA-binding transcriptional MerR regulator
MEIESSERTYPLKAVVRSTGLSEHLLRAWERRYRAILPRRTPGGTRRYSDADVARLQLLRAGVNAGHPISELASLPDAELEGRFSEHAASTGASLHELLAAVERLDTRELERLLTVQFHVLGPQSFARRVADPLMAEIGQRWARGEIEIAAEHLATSMLRSILGLALRASSSAERDPPILFTTPPSERHELGALIAAVAAVAAGGNAIYLGPELPLADLSAAVRRLDAAVVALSVVHLEPGAGASFLRALHERLGPEVEIWLGGAGAAELANVPGVTLVESLEDLERRVGLMIHSNR